MNEKILQALNFVSDTMRNSWDAVMSKTGMIPLFWSFQSGREVSNWIILLVMSIIVTQRTTKVNIGCSETKCSDIIRWPNLNFRNGRRHQRTLSLRKLLKRRPEGVRDNLSKRKWLAYVEALRLEGIWPVWRIYQPHQTKKASISCWEVSGGES